MFVKGFYTSSKENFTNKVFCGDNLLYILKRSHFNFYLRILSAFIDSIYMLNGKE